MNKLMRRLRLLVDAIIGNLLKLRVNFDLYVRKYVSVSKDVDSSLIVSLTTYGYRAKHSVQYTLYSLMKQEVRPAKILLWLDEKEFDESHLPKALVILKEMGVCVCFCENIHSYKKLIPALRLYPNKNIITVDDDLYYSSNLTRELLSLHRQYPNAIIAEACTVPQWNENGKLLPYAQWPKYHLVEKTFSEKSMLIFPVGYGGVFYPVGAFDGEIFNQEIFTRLCPIADDIWFYIQGIRCHREKIMDVQSKVRYYQVDLFRQAMHKDRLTQQNAAEGKNDTQLQRLLIHYYIDLSVLR